jgi:hypothetical protein
MNVRASSDTAPNDTASSDTASSETTTDDVTTNDVSTNHGSTNHVAANNVVTNGMNATNRNAMNPNALKTNASNVDAMTVRLGSRRSALATAQAGMMADQLRELGHTVEMVEITTTGDTSTASLSTIGGTGVFAAAIRRALLDGEIDIAVHSLKDLPVAPEPGLVIAAIPPREDARDALVARDGMTLGELPPGSVVGTGSPRRVAQLSTPGSPWCTTVPAMPFCWPGPAWLVSAG